MYHRRIYQAHALIFRTQARGGGVIGLETKDEDSVSQLFTTNTQRMSCSLRVVGACFV
jgi:hypothetical protein